MRWLNVLRRAIGPTTVVNVSNAEIASPEAAVRTLEAAYMARDLEGAVAAKDFLTEARLMWSKISPGVEKDQAVLRQTAEVLEAAYRQELHDHGFPSMRNVRCQFTAREVLSDTMVKLTEECAFPDGAKAVQDLYAVKTERGWRVAVLPD